MFNKFFSMALPVLVLGTLVPTTNAHAIEGCRWGRGNGPVHFVAEAGTLFVPRDAKIGETIGQFEKSFITTGFGNIIYCLNEHNTLLEFSTRATAPIAPALPAGRHRMLPLGSVVQTNIPGVGATIRLDSPYDGITRGNWKLISPDSTMPFSAYNDEISTGSLQYSYLAGWITLIKTGEIAPGTHRLDTSNELFQAQFTNIPYAWGVALTGSVTRAECTLSANPVSADPVELGEWTTDSFTGTGATTQPTAFNIALNACVSDPATDGTQTTAYLRLEPTAGSSIVDADQGLFSLGNGATAKGVAIQLLKSDGSTPVPLASDISQGAIPVSGSLLLQFSARYYQTGAVKAGSASGALAFTITYK